MNDSTSGSVAAFGGEHLAVTYRDGRTETVLVRELEIDPGLLKFGQLIDEVAALVEFVCAREAGWAATLSRLSLMEIYDKAIDLNFTVARLYLRSRVKLMQGLKEMPSGSPSTISASAAG